MRSSVNNSLKMCGEPIDTGCEKVLEDALSNTSEEGSLRFLRGTNHNYIIFKYDKSQKRSNYDNIIYPYTILFKNTEKSNDTEDVYMMLIKDENKLNDIEKNCI